MTTVVETGFAGETEATYDLFDRGAYYDHWRPSISRPGGAEPEQRRRRTQDASLDLMCLARFCS